MIAKYHKGLLKRCWGFIILFLFYFLLLTLFTYIQIKNRDIDKRDMSREGEGFIILFIYFYLLVFSAALIHIILRNKGIIREDYKIIFMTTIVCTIITMVITSFF